MLHRKTYNYIIAGCVILAACLILASCCNTIKENVAAGVSDEESKGNAQLWAENCGRCHNLRTPSSYGDVQWEVAMHHMRVRADLTAVEQKKILEFLQSAN
jgi:cytochrome c553